jgi:nucleoside-diphosphate-sugar epimerase
MAHSSLVTGVAGFIGSHLADTLLRQGESVVGIDAFTEYYDPAIKRANVAPLLEHPGFRLIEADLTTFDLRTALEGCDVVYHQAGQPGVRASWGDDFQLYLARNLQATQRLLEAIRAHPVRKLVFASSSSVYGDAERYPTAETDLPRPISPYGVSKLAGEHLCRAYAAGYGVPVVALRYFTVYGPRQRPDMAFNRFIRAVLAGDEITVYGDGKQTRDFTFVSDIVAANIAAANSDLTSEVINTGGGSRVTVLEVLDLLGAIIGKQPRIRFVETQRGDVRHTGADLSKARALLSYEPRVPLAEGLRRQVEAIAGA